MSFARVTFGFVRSHDLSDDRSSTSTSCASSPTFGFASTGDGQCITAPARSLVITLSDAMLARLTLPLVVAAGVATLAVLFANAPIAAHFVGTRQPLGPLLAYAPWIEAGCAVGIGGGTWR